MKSRVMNTKQLWTALTLNPKTNFYFNGIFSIDTLKEIKEKPDLFICNTDPSDQPGEHWVLFFFNENSVDFYDSLGCDITYYGSKFINFIKNYTFNFEQCLRRMQPVESDLLDIIVCIMLLLTVMVFLWKKLLIICFLTIMWWSL